MRNTIKQVRTMFAETVRLMSCLRRCAIQSNELLRLFYPRPRTEQRLVPSYPRTHRCAREGGSHGGKRGGRTDAALSHSPTRPGADDLGHDPDGMGVAGSLVLAWHLWYTHRTLERTPCEAATPVGHRKGSGLPSAQARGTPQGAKRLSWRPGQGSISFLRVPHDSKDSSVAPLPQQDAFGTGPSTLSVAPGGSATRSPKRQVGDLARAERRKAPRQPAGGLSRHVHVSEPSRRRVMCWGSTPNRRLSRAVSMAHTSAWSWLTRR